MFQRTLLRKLRQHTEWEKIFANYISEKGLGPRIYKEFLQLDKQPNLKNR